MLEVLVLNVCCDVLQEQDPGFYGQEVASASKVVLDIRYTLLPYLYSLFYEVNARGGTVVRPLGNE